MIIAGNRIKAVGPAATTKVPRDKLPERVAKLVSEHRQVAPPTVAMQNLPRVWNAGITVVMGTDAGNGTLHGPGARRREPEPRQPRIQGRARVHTRGAHERCALKRPKPQGDARRPN